MTIAVQQVPVEWDIRAAPDSDPDPGGKRLSAK
jgi:hypothetical protein